MLIEEQGYLEAGFDQITSMPSGQFPSYPLKFVCKNGEKIYDINEPGYVDVRVRFTPALETKKEIQIKANKLLNEQAVIEGLDPITGYPTEASFTDSSKLIKEEE